MRSTCVFPGKTNQNICRAASPLLCFIRAIYSIVAKNYLHINEPHWVTQSCFTMNMDTVFRLEAIQSTRRSLAALTGEANVY